MASLPQKRGDGAPGDATVLRFARLLAKAWRPPAHRPTFSFGAGPRFPAGRLREAASGLRRVCRHFWRPLRQETAGKPQRLHRQPAPGGRPVLATRRSPGAARVRGRSVRLPPAGAASGSIIRRLMMTPLDRAGR